VQRINHVERIIHLLEFLANALDVTVDCTIIDINLIIVSGVHQSVAAFDYTVRSDNYLGRSYCLTEECSRGGSCCLMKDAPIASWLHELSSLLWRFLLFDRAAGFLPPRP
jgi:hypothetical protein